MLIAAGIQLQCCRLNSRGQITLTLSIISSQACSHSELICNLSYYGGDLDTSEELQSSFEKAVLTEKIRLISITASDIVRDRIMNCHTFITKIIIQ